MRTEDVNSYLRYPQTEKKEFISSSINGISEHQIL